MRCSYSTLNAARILTTKKSNELREILKLVPHMNPSELTQSLKSESNRLGFDLVGACPAVTPNGFDQFIQWIEAGYHGEMLYLEDRKSAYQHPKHVLPEVQSLLMLGMSYNTDQPKTTTPGQGRIASYASGTADYHDLIHKRLKELKKFAISLDETMFVRGVVDTAPLLEREFAELAGLGWRAKNSLLINKSAGSWFFLAALLVSRELEYDTPMETGHCGTCTACLTSCPTDAFIGPGVLDATRCVSYLTIEHRSQVPLELRSGMDDWILGCDVCQDVCPWNRKATKSMEPAFNPIDELNPLELRPLFSLTDDEFRKRFRKTPLWRPKRRGILRNAAIVLGNHPDDQNIEALSMGLQDDEELVRGASAWALGQHSNESALAFLRARQKTESSNEVLDEIKRAIKGVR